MKKLKIYNDTKEFWDEVSPHLKKEEAKNSLFLGLALLFKSKPQNCSYQGAIWENDKLLASILCSDLRGQKILVVTPTDIATNAKLLLDSINESKVKIDCLVGEINTAKIYESLIRELGLNCKVNVKQGIYKCSNVIMPKIQNDFTFRLANENDYSLIGDWIEIFHQEAVPHGPPINGLETAKIKINDKLIYLLEKENKPVSMVGRSRDLGSSCSVNLVFTPRVLRKNGYASIVTAKLTQTLFEEGKRETNLYTDMANPTSNKIYQNIGYVFVCHSIHYSINH